MIKEQTKIHFSEREIPMKIANDVFYVGVNDHKVDLFEGQYVVPNGMAYNSYVIMDEKIAVFDTVDAKFTHEWLDNLGAVLGTGPITTRIMLTDLKDVLKI